MGLGDLADADAAEQLARDTHRTTARQRADAQAQRIGVAVPAVLARRIPQITETMRLTADVMERVDRQWVRTRDKRRRSSFRDALIAMNKTRNLPARATTDTAQRVLEALFLCAEAIAMSEVELSKLAPRLLGELRDVRALLACEIAHLRAPGPSSGGVSA